ncbi:interferon-induced protein 44-like, partial [Clarias magur]
ESNHIMGGNSSTFEKPWRPVNWRSGNRDAMLQALRDFQSNRNVDHLRILVVGPAGAGKSAFITSVNTVFQGHNTYLAHSLTGGLSATLKYTVYKLNKGTEGSFFPFVFGDTMGLESGSDGAKTEEIVAILHGHIPEGFTFSALEELTADSNDYNRTPALHDKFHCLVFVVPASNIAQLPVNIIAKIKEIQQKARKLGIPQVVIMSKVDKACPQVQENLQMIYRSKKIKEEVEKCSTILGVPVNYILPVKNYHEEIANKTEIDILLLMAVTTIVNFANEFVKASGKPWRTVTWSDKDAMLQTLRDFQSNRNVDHLRILVVGPAGAGKSAFITSINTVLQGRNTYLAHSLTGGSSATRKHTVYKLNKGTEGSFFPFVFGDTMGLEEGLDGAKTDEIVGILHGHISEGFTFNALEELTAHSSDYNRTPSLNDKVHCLVFVLPASNIAQLPNDIIAKIKEIQKNARRSGIPEVVIMSKVDKACSQVKESLEMIYRSKKIKEG